MKSLRNTLSFEVSPDVRRRSRSEIDRVLYWPEPDHCGIVPALGRFGNLGGEMVLHTRERADPSGRRPPKRPVKGLYYAATLPAGLSQANRQRAAEVQRNADDSRGLLEGYADRLGWLNFISLDRLRQLLEEPRELGVAMRAARDPAKVEAHELLTGIVGPDNLHYLVAAANALQERNQHLGTAVASAWVSHSEWAAQILREHDRLMRLICHRLVTSDLEAVGHEIAKPLEELMIKPWTFFKAFVFYTGRRDIPWQREPDFYLRLINAAVLEGSHADLIRTVTLAENAQSATERTAAITLITERISWLNSLKLPWGYGGDTTQRRLRERLVISLERLKLRLRHDHSTSDGLEATPVDSVSARKQDGNQLRWDLRYRALPGDQEFEMWYGIW